MGSMALPYSNTLPVLDKSTFDLEIKAIKRMRARFSFLTVFTIIVSFIHMAVSLTLFSKENVYEQGAALLMTVLVDIVTWMVASYVDYARVRNLQRSGWALALFFASLCISALLNFSYLYANRPPETVIPYFASVMIAFAFAIFVPGTIAVSSIVSGELYRDLLARQTEQIEAANAALVPVVVPIANPEPTALPSNTESLERPIAPRPRPSPRPSSRKPAAVDFRVVGGNGKTAIMTGDVAGILAELARQGVTELASGADLAKRMGWNSASSGPKGMRSLQDAGVLRSFDGVFVVGSSRSDSNEAPSEAPDGWADELETAFATPD